MTDIHDPDYDDEARRRLAALDEIVARWAEEAGDRLRMPQRSGDGPAAIHHAGGAGDVRTDRDGAVEGGAGRPRRPHRWAWPSGILAAAAAVVVILLAREPESPAPSPGESGIPLVADDLDAASDGSFMVVPTRNPDIAVIWMLDSGD